LILGIFKSKYEPRHDKTNIMGLRQAWIQTSLRIRTVWSGSMLFAISVSTCYRVCKRTAWILIRLREAQAGLDPCWSQTHYVGFVIGRLIYSIVIKHIKKQIRTSNRWCKAFAWRSSSFPYLWNPTANKPVYSRDIKDKLLTVFVFINLHSISN
jgi:hypothetical protein